MVIEVIKPIDSDDFTVGDEIKFEGKADNQIEHVRIFAEDRWLLGTSKVDNGTWAIAYRFNTAGNRQIVVKGFNALDQVTATENIWIFLHPASLLDQSLSQDFKLWELIRSSTADRLGIDNTPTDQEIKNLRTLCQQILQPARDALGPLKITSGFRSAALNQAVGGAPNSDHRLGFGADVIPVNVGTRKFAEWVKNNCQFDQIILEFGTAQDPNWIHVSAHPRNRREVLRASFQRGQTVYTPINI